MSFGGSRLPARTTLGAKYQLAAVCTDQVERHKPFTATNPALVTIFDQQESCIDNTVGSRIGDNRPSHPRHVHGEVAFS
jgi:hypothetical protein